MRQNSCDLFADPWGFQELLRGVWFDLTLAQILIFGLLANRLIRRDAYCFFVYFYYHDNCSLLNFVYHERLDLRTTRRLVGSHQVVFRARLITIQFSLFGSSVDLLELLQWWIHKNQIQVCMVHMKGCGRRISLAHLWSECCADYRARIGGNSWLCAESSGEAHRQGWGKSRKKDCWFD